MTETTKRTALIAQWTLNQDPTIEAPHTVEWANGTSASFEDYLAHMTDTHTWIAGSTGIELYMFPYLADVRYDYSAGIWMIDGVGPTSIALDITDPNALDEQIIAALYTCLVVYKARIYR
jgi:hypothetical protein